MLAERPVIELVKEPAPVPLLVELALGMVGDGDVPQTTPLAVTDELPSLVTFPPAVALKLPMDEATVVVIVGMPLTVTITLLVAVQPPDEAVNVYVVVVVGETDPGFWLEEVKPAGEDVQE